MDDIRDIRTSQDPDSDDESELKTLNVKKNEVHKNEEELYSQWKLLQTGEEERRSKIECADDLHIGTNEVVQWVAYSMFLP